MIIAIPLAWKTRPGPIITGVVLVELIRVTPTGPMVSSLLADGKHGQAAVVMWPVPAPHTNGFVFDEIKLLTVRN